MDVIVNADRVFTVEPSKKDTASSIATAAAEAHGVRGQLFTLKANGVVLRGSELVAGLDGPFELIEHVPADGEVAVVEAPAEPAPIEAFTLPA